MPDPYVMSRVRYYNGEFLKEGEFIDEQRYHIDRRERHDRLLHEAGIAEGLDVVIGDGGATVTVSPGTAVDEHGRQILLPATQTFNVDTTWAGVMIVEIAFSEIEDVVADQSSAVQANTRFTQRSVAVARPVAATATEGAVHLASVTTNAPSFPTTATGVSLGERAYSGVRLPGPANTANSEGTLRSQGDASPGWAQLGCSLSVRGDSAVSGDATIDGALTAGSASVTGVGSFGAPSLPSGGGSYALAAGDVAASGKVLIGALGALPQAPSTLYVGGSEIVTGASRFGAPSLPAGSGEYTLGAGDLASSGKALFGVLSALPQAPPTLYVGGAASVTSTLAVGGAASVTGTLTVNGATSLTSNLAVGGTASVTSTLTVTGAAILNSGLTVAAAASVGTNLTVGGIASVTNNLVVGGAASVTGLLTAGSAMVNGAAALNGTTNLGSDLFANGKNLYLGPSAGTTSGVVHSSAADGPFVFGNNGGVLGSPFKGVRLNKSASQSIVLPSTSASFASGFSFSTWVYFYSLDDYAQIISLSTGGNANNIIVGSFSSGSVLFSLGGFAFYLTAPGVLAANQWVHLAVTRASTGLVTIYRNGVSIGSGTVSFVPPNGTRNSNLLGYTTRSNPTEPYLNAILSQVTLWNTARAWAENNFNTTFAGNETGLLGYWKLNNVNGTSAPDSCTNASHLGDGTLMNAPALAAVPMSNLIWDANLNVAIGGNLKVAGNNVMQCKGERGRVVRGYVNSDHTIATGSGDWSVASAGVGVYDITFNPPFTDVPAVTVTQVYSPSAINGNVSGTAGLSTDNAVVVGISTSVVRVATGQSNGTLTDRAFTFIAVGP